MNKEEILKKVKKDGLDEREQEILNGVFRIATITAIILCGLFFLSESLKGRRAYELFVIMGMIPTVFNFYCYKKLNTRKYLITSICTFIFSIVYFLLYIL